MKPIVVVVVGLLVVVGIVTLLTYNYFRVIKQTERFNVGPFTIRADAVTGKTWNINYGLVDSTSIAYSIWFDDKPIAPPDTLETNTGLPFLWKVYEVKGVSEPTLIAGSQSLFMVKIKDGKPLVTSVHKQYSDFATLQFLDSHNGQPGKVHTICMANNLDDMTEIEVLEGGRLLLVYGLKVLDVETGESWSFSENGRSFENYSFPSPQEKGAIGLSPDQSQIVFHGEFQTWNHDETEYFKHAMVVYDFKSNAAYKVPYDDNETRLVSFADVDHAWLMSRFQWIETGAGRHELKLKNHGQSYPWLGKYNSQDNYYVLYPVEPGMLPPFLDFVLSRLNWSKSSIVHDETKIYAGRTITLEQEGIKLDINFREEDKHLSLSKHLYLSIPSNDTTYTDLVRKIAEAFNQKLSEGEFQQYFGKPLREKY
ncbi:MAG: hypothetical protein ACK5PB_00960 [Pirellula sp.]|jgi:hypothetical protein